MQTLLKLYNDQIGGDHDVIDDNSQPRKKKKSVQFHSDSDKLNVVHLFHNDNRTGNDDEDDGCLPAVIHFKHSNVEGDSYEVAADSDEPIRSPSDVYRCFGNCGKVVKSILKAPERGVTLDPSLECRREVAAKPVSTSTIQAVSEVVEHETVASSREEPSRPVSRFKAARLAARK
ncbi:uncharacterized protein LOC120350055 [Nilaparvata lugens]|uniref:uncharacterized protein LOC120350055 n=1 Tax=Nilaparvata lugens TaxID=108931 RepID=UPI00193D7BC3|nr:uncharacterized protein LOC120350055 [Nilaparvata lugens]